MSPTDDRDIRAALSADRPQRTDAELEAAAGRLLEAWPPDKDGDHIGPGRSMVFRCVYGGWTHVHMGTVQQGKPSETRTAAAVDLLRHHPELWPAEPEPEPDPLREAAREALRFLTEAQHDGEEDDNGGCCWVCDEPWPCDVEQARRRLAAALEDR